MKIKDYLSNDEYHLTEKLTNWQLIDYFNNFNEVFDKYKQIKIIEMSKESFVTKFVINDIDYYFHSDITDDSAIVIFYPLDEEWDLFKERKTNTGYLGSLFGTVIQSLKLMIENYDLNTIGFTAENKKLESIYNLLDKTIQKRFPDWKLDKIDINKGKKNYIYKRK